MKNQKNIFNYLTEEYLILLRQLSQKILAKNSKILFFW